jgi:hypothetical protein
VLVQVTEPDEALGALGADMRGLDTSARAGLGCHQIAMGGSTAGTWVREIRAVDAMEM